MMVLTKDPWRASPSKLARAKHCGIHFDPTKMDNDLLSARYDGIQCFYDTLFVNNRLKFHSKAYIMIGLHINTIITKPLQK